ncbi:MAG: ATP-dependent helicase [Candidatus Cloacimonetes bacterium]|nr:ATP-dependent helicase [Candidatus Cloacimonadota bacterium]
MAILNPEQIKAIEYDGSVLLRACPGSGKTLVLTHKLAYELGRLDALSKKRVIAVTFTIRAADEIEKRLCRMGVRDKRAWSGTLHSFCLEWIAKPYSSYIPHLRNGFNIADEIYCLKLMDSLKKKHKLQKAPSQRLNRDGSFVEEGTKERILLKEYHCILLSNKYIDFDMLLLYSYQILTKYPKISVVLAHMFRIICVDEYQDTQCLLYAIISSIVVAGGGCTSIFLVGDADQAIYGSLGGVAKSYEEIQQEFNPISIESLTLSGNYRSTQRIIDFNTNYQTSKISIKAVGINANEKGIVSYNHRVGASDLSREIAEIIRHNLDRGVMQNEICVLVPQWWMVSRITKQLRSLLPNVDFDASGLAQLFRNRDNVWFKFSRLLLTQPSARLYAVRYKWAREFIDSLRMHIGIVIDSDFREERRMLRIVNSIKSSKLDIVDFYQDCIHQFLTLEQIGITDYPLLADALDRFISNLQEKLNATTDPLPNEVEYFRSLYKEKKGVVINTCMGIKGEEFDTVISCGLLRGYVPHWEEIFAGKELESSKKLLYVVCSRARLNLYLISETGRQQRNGTHLEPTRELIGCEFQYDV